MARIYLSPPEVGLPEEEAVVAAIRSNWVAPIGPDLTAFEQEVAEASGRAHGVGLSSGTAAIHLALRELGVGAGDEVLTSTFTFAGTCNPIAYQGATPVFVDSDPDDWNVSAELLEEAIQDRLGTTGTVPKAAVLVDLYGRTADWAAIVPVLERHGIPLVEDAAEALGARAAGGAKAGSFGVAGILSFNGNKLITTGGGGMLVTDDERLAGRVRHLSTQAREPFPHYEHVEIGFNYRLSNLLAALGRAQLAQVERKIARRRELNARYRAGLADLDHVAFAPGDPDGGRWNGWLTCITIDPASGVTPEQVRRHLEADDIETRPTWKPMHLQPVFASAPAYLDGTAEHLFTTGLCLPSGSSLSDGDQDRVLTRLREALSAAG